ncbi:MAG: glycosyltransferase [Actinobacteria bacterium]|nr:glycosyltransferase [Actinomycetota bacterium]
MKACTIISRSHLPFARVLADSYSACHGDRISVLVFDDVGGGFSGEGEGFDLVRPEDLPLDRRDFHTMAAIYEPRELASALKPWLIDHLHGQGSDVVLYLDADMDVYAPLDEVDALARQHGIVLTPHLLEPLPRDDLSPRETDLLMAGTFNLGFIAVAAGNGDFLSWWKERLRRDCIISPADGYFADQRWLDILPDFIPRHVLRDPAFNVAYWNLASRNLTFENDDFLVDGMPLRCFHLSGFDPDAPHLLSRHQGTRPRILLSQNPATARICDRYARQLRKHGHGSPDSPRGFGFDSAAGGLSFSKDLRRACRRLLLEDTTGEEPFPDPFDIASSDEFTSWLNSPLPSSPQAGISRLLSFIHDSRLDLKLNFPDIHGADADRFLDWVLEHGGKEHGIPSECLPKKTGGRRRRTSIEPGMDTGVNVAGYINSQSGLGESVRLILETLKAGGIPHVTMAPLEATQSRQLDSDLQTAAACFDISIICVNADQFPVFASNAGLELFDGRYTIAVWAWELEEHPGGIDPVTLGSVDEIWTYSDHAVKALAEATGKPVYKFPLPVSTPALLSTDRQLTDSSPPDGFSFLFCFDFLSVMERKNPLAVIEAFKLAFDPGEGPALIIKTINGDRRILEMERLAAAAAGRPDIRVIDGYLSREDQQALISSCDAYVSLHRAEGFGLTMAEAMAHGKPVIATGYSGNLEFMDDDNSYLVPFTMTEVPGGCAPYPRGYAWADPDTEAAASYIRLVYDNPDEARLKAEKARSDMAEMHSPEARLDLINRRLGGIRGRKVTKGPGRQPGGFILKRFRGPATTP